MRQDGVEILAHWRESGAWWQGEAPQEFVQWRDKRGVRRESSRQLAHTAPVNQKVDWHEDNSVEITLRPRKTRDEKVAMACGHYREDMQGLVRRLPSLSGGYAPLHLLSGYSFGRSVALAREYPRRLASLGVPAAALVDRFALTGAVEFDHECRALGVKPLIGATFEMDVGGEVTLIAADKHGYVSLSRLVTECHLGEPRLYPLCTAERLARHSRGLICLTGGDVGRLDRLLLAQDWKGAQSWIDHLVGLYGRSNVFVEVERSWLPWGVTVERRLDEIARANGLVQVAGGTVTHGERAEFPAQDVALCAESLCTVDEVTGRKPLRSPCQAPVPDRPLRSLNDERYLKAPHDMAALFADRPELLMNTLSVAGRCDDTVLPSRTRLPPFCQDSNARLREATTQGAVLRHRDVTPRLKRRLEFELERIVRLNFADHFLVMWDVCRWADERHIQHSGRGSVVDSAVAYCLGFSRIDAFRHNLHFDRFLPEDGSKRPDIDVDFEAKRRDDIREYMVTKYGKDHVATVSAIGAYNTRGIVREVGKALGLPDQVVGFLAKRVHGGVVPEQLENALDKRPELRDSAIDRDRLHWLFALAKSLADVPRNMRAHSSGVVISADPLSDTVPVQWAGDTGNDEPLRIVQWDKRSAKHYFDKFDVLCLRGHDVLSGTESRVRLQQPCFAVEDVPADDPESFRAMRAGELIGVPQSASPAMRQAHMRLRTENFHDASLVQAGIRPGVGGAVKLNELIARRRGLKPYTFDHPDLEPILGNTYGIVVFQEQIDQLLQTFGGYGSGEAEDIRDAIHKRRKEDYGQTIKTTLIDRIVGRGYPPELAEKVFDYIAGFKGYGFAQGHALAFAEISLRSVHCQQNYPAEYFAALLDAQPAGYYGPCTLVNEARSRGVVVLPVDINLSRESYDVCAVTSDQEPRVTLPNAGLRVPFCAVSGVSRQLIERTVSNQPFGSFFDYVRRAAPDQDELERLVLVGAFDTLSPNRRALLWAVCPALAWAKSTSGGLFDGSADEPQVPEGVPDFTDAEKAVRERAVLGLDVEQHLMTYERDRVSGRGGLTCGEVKRLPPGRTVIVVGNPIRLRFPPTPSGKRVVFFDLEDESGLLNVTCFDRAYQRDGHAIVTSPYVTLIGTTQDRDGHTAFLVKRAFPYEPHITKLVDLNDPIPVKTADFLVG